MTHERLVWDDSADVTWLPDVAEKAVTLDVASGNPYREEGTMRFAAREAVGRVVRDVRERLGRMRRTRAERRADSPEARAEAERATNRARRMADLARRRAASRAERRIPPGREHDPDASFLLASPEQRTGRSIHQAHRDVQVGQQRAFRAAQATITRSLGLGDAVTRDAIGLWQDPTAGIGAEASTATTLPAFATHDDAVLAAVMMGRLTNQKAVIAYTPDRAGNDVRVSVYGMRGSAAKLYKDFARAGIENVTLVRDNGAWTAHLIGFHDFVGEDGLTAMLTNAKRIATARGATRTTFSTGKATYVGKDTRDDANAEYDRIIADARSRALARTGGRDGFGWWDDLHAQWEGAALQTRLGRAERRRPSVTKRDLRARLSQIAEVIDAWIEKQVLTLPVTSGNPYRTAQGMRFASRDGLPYALSGPPTPLDQEVDAHLPGASLARVSSVFETDDATMTPLKWRNRAVAELIGDMAAAGRLRTTVSDEELDAAVAPYRTMTGPLTAADRRTMRNRLAKLVPLYRATAVAQWDRVLAPLYEQGAAAGADWYDDTESVIDQVFGADARAFRVMLGATSGGNKLTSNLTKALSVYVQWRIHGRQVPDPDARDGGFVGDMATNLAVVKSAFLHGFTHGSKLGNFVRALEGDRDAITVDLWMARAFKLKRLDTATKKLVRNDAPTDTDFIVVDRVIRARARAMGQDPRAVQAAIWRATILRDDPTRTNIDSYDRLLQQRALGRPNPRRRVRRPDDALRATLVPDTAEGVWTILDGSKLARQVLRRLLADTRRTVQKVTRRELVQWLGGLLALEVRLDEAAWHARMAALVPTMARACTWSEALAHAEQLATWASWMRDDDAAPLQKHNPYHDSNGRFTTRENAVAAGTLSPYDRERRGQLTLADELRSVSRDAPVSPGSVFSWSRLFDVPHEAEHRLSMARMERQPERTVHTPFDVAYRAMRRTARTETGSAAATSLPDEYTEVARLHDVNGVPLLEYGSLDEKAVALQLATGFLDVLPKAVVMTHNHPNRLRGQPLRSAQTYDDEQSLSFGDIGWAMAYNVPMVRAVWRASSNATRAVGVTERVTASWLYNPAHTDAGWQRIQRQLHAPEIARHMTAAGLDPDVIADTDPLQGRKYLAQLLYRAVRDTGGRHRDRNSKGLSSRSRAVANALHALGFRWGRDWRTTAFLRENQRSRAMTPDASRHAGDFDASSDTRSRWWQDSSGALRRRPGS